MKHNKVGSVMTTEVVRAEYGTPFKEVARLLADHRISGLPVVDEDDHVIGVISETDAVADHRAQRLLPLRAQLQRQRDTHAPQAIPATASAAAAPRKAASTAASVGPIGKDPVIAAGSARRVVSVVPSGR